MRLGVRPEAHAAAFDALGEPPQIALEGVEIDDQCRGVDLIEAHADLGGWARRHRSSPALGDRRRLAHGLGKCNTPSKAVARRSGPSIPRVGNNNIPRHDARELARRWPDRPRLKRPHREEKTMAEAMVSGAEDALENQRIGGLQLRVAALCALVQICDGYDINSVGVTVPQLTHAWNLPGPAFTTAFLWSSIGIMVGALSAGPIGDRIGRKPLLLGSLTVFGLASLASGFAGSLFMLTILRFFTGLGIGGAFPGAATLTGDYAPHRRRALMIMVSFTGAPVGGFLCGQIAGVLLPAFGWPSIFLVGGIVPLLMV